MIDLGKIDFTRLTLPDWGGVAVTVSTGAHGVELRRGHGLFAHLLGDVWQYAQATWTVLVVAKTYTDRVDRFIVDESMRLAVEDEAANWVPVPWQDAGWLSNGGTSVQCLDDEIREWVRFPCQFNALGRSSCSYRANRRTFPAGYDPTKPRCVDVPKSEPRPCTRGFALEHPGESEYRWRYGSGDDWFPWDTLETYAGDANCEYEFRTTASECTVIPDLEVTASDPPPLVVGLGVQLRKGVAVVGGDHVCIDDHGRVRFAKGGTPIGDLVIRL